MAHYHNLNVLDVGCAKGANSLFLVRKGAKVDAVDIDADALSDFQYNNIFKYNTDIISFFNKHIRKRYDVIIALNILQFLPIKEIKRILPKILTSCSPGGMLIIEMFNSPVVDFINRQIEGFKVLDYGRYLKKDQKPNPHTHQMVFWVLIKPKKGE